MRFIEDMLAKLCLAWLIVGFSPCGSAQSAPPAAGPAPLQQPPSSVINRVTPPESKPKPNPVPADPFAAVAQLVDKVAALPELSKDALERVLGVTLTHLPDAGRDEQYYQATLASGPFSRVEVRQSNPSQSSFALVIFDVRAGVSLPLEKFRNAARVRPDMPVNVNPHVPPEGTVTFTDTHGSQQLRYEFTAKTDLLRGVIFDRRPSR
jgi:hypothetical protein